MEHVNRVSPLGLVIEAVRVSHSQVSKGSAPAVRLIRSVG